MITKSNTHDYSGPTRRIGHDYIFKPVGRGMKGNITGWGYGIRSGDFLLLQNRGKSTRYRVDSISYYLDPMDMWSAEVTFAPRGAGE